jgi:hypothetical protein
MIGLPMTSISTALGYPYSTDYQALKVPRLQIQTLLHRLLDGRRRPVIGSSFRIGRFCVGVEIQVAGIYPLWLAYRVHSKSFR